MGTGISIKVFTDLERRVRENEKFIDGTNGGKDGAKSRLSVLEDNYRDIKHSLNWILGLIAGIFIGIAIWFFTEILPKIVTHVAFEVPKIASFFGVR